MTTAGNLSSSWALPPPSGQALLSPLITELNPNDVLLGRGALCDRFPGNIQFRALIRNRKDEYCSAHTSNKKIIAQEIVASVHSTGGRFLCRCLKPANGADISHEERLHSGVSHVNFHSTTWKIANEGVAIEKVKQALRDMNSDDSKSSNKKEPPKKVAADPSRRPARTRPRRAAHSSFSSQVSEDAKLAAIIGHKDDQAPPTTDVAGTHSELREEEIALVRGLLARMATDAPAGPAVNHHSGEQPARDRSRAFSSAGAAQSEPLASASSSAAFASSGFATSAATLEHSHSMAAFSSASNDNSHIRSLVEHAVLLRLQQEQQQRYARFVSSLARSPLDAATALRVSSTWREIPGNYLRMLPTLQQQQQQLNGSTAPFTNDDWHILSLTRAWAESQGHALCLAQIGLFLTQLVREVPSSRVQLSLGEAQELVQALGELQGYTLNGLPTQHSWMGHTALR
jgi:hypothetical protein